MIRCYMGADKVAGFGHQFIKALIPPPPKAPIPRRATVPRVMHGADAAPFQALRAKMETEWVPQMTEVLGIDLASLPIIWDADFLYGPRTATGEDSYVLCEINVSSCFAIPAGAGGDCPAGIASLRGALTSVTEITVSNAAPLPPVTSPDWIWGLPEREGGIGPVRTRYSFSRRRALPFSSFSRSSAHSGRVLIHSAPGGFSTNG